MKVPDEVCSNSAPPRQTELSVQLDVLVGEGCLSEAGVLRREQ